MGTEEISYQNKDITSKFLAEHLKGKTFRVSDRGRLRRRSCRNWTQREFFRI